MTGLDTVYVKTSNRLIFVYKWRWILLSADSNQFGNFRSSEQLSCHEYYRSNSDSIIKLNVLFITGHYGTEKLLLVLTSEITLK